MYGQNVLSRIMYNVGKIQFIVIKMNKWIIVHL